MSKDVVKLSLHSPEVTVLMSVYNGETHLKEAVESILNQTFRDFEFIIINDGSMDGTAAILAPYESIDRRIHIYHQENRGLIASLNRGCQLSKGKYIARMDADDISLPDRIAKQVGYMETHQDVGVIGTWVDVIDDKCRIVGSWHMPTASGVIGWSLFFANPLAHSSVIIRRNVVERLGFYRSDALHAEDYDLWARASLITRIVNMPEVLLQYRLSHQSVSSRYSKTQEQTKIQISHWMIRQFLGSEASFETVANLNRVSKQMSLDDLQQIQEVATVISNLYKAYLGRHSLNRVEHREVSRDASMTLCRLAISARRFSLSKGFAILVEAVKIHPQLILCRLIMTKGTSIGLLQM